VSAKTKIKVLECIRQGEIGGGESHLLSIAENLDRTKFDLVVLSFTDGPMIERLKERGVETHIVFSKLPFDIPKWPKVKKILREQQIDIVHTHGSRACSNVMIASKSLMIPVIYTIHGWSFHSDQNFFVRNARIWAEKILTSKADINISVSNSNRQTGINHITGFKSIVIYNGINQKKFSPYQSYKDIRHALGISPNAILVSFIARVTTHKQPLVLIRAFKKSLSNTSNLHLLIVGEGDQKQEAIRLAEDLELANKVTFQPFRQDVPEILAASDLFVLPSLWEGFSIGLIEAMSMGKAVIATNVDGTKEVIQNNVNGMLIEPGNIQALAESITRLANDKLLRQDLGQNALITVQEQFNSAVMTRKIEDLYIDLYERKKFHKVTH